jgi:hypothetical protein
MLPGTDWGGDAWHCQLPSDCLLANIYHCSQITMQKIGKAQASSEPDALKEKIQKFQATVEAYEALGKTSSSFLKAEQCMLNM